MGAHDATGTVPPVEPLIENRTFDEIEVGESALLERTLSWEDIELFAVISGDINPDRAVSARR